ncbi:hypothetical protein [Streptomyces sp. NPDC088350]
MRFGGLFIAGHISKSLLLAAVTAGVLVTAATAVGLKSLHWWQAPVPA